MALTTLLARPLTVVNVGLELFAEELKREGVTVVHVDWRPPAGAPDIAALLARLDDGGR
jgi:FdrA protein